MRQVTKGNNNYLDDEKKKQQNEKRSKATLGNGRKV